MKTKASIDTEKQIALSNHIFAHSFAVLFGFLGASFGLAIDEIIFTVFGRKTKRLLQKYYKGNVE